MSTDPQGGAPDWPGPRAAADWSLTTSLAESDGAADELGTWSEALWGELVAVGAHRWSLPVEFGGEAIDRPELVRRYARVAEGSLTAAFVLSQHDAAVRRLVPAAERPGVADRLRAIGRGEAFATVGISQLTTSRRHGAAALVAHARPEGYRLEGVMPWVTAAERADLLVTGAATVDGQQLLLMVPTDRSGLTIERPFRLAALQASCTTEVRCVNVEVAADDLLAGPSPDVMAAPGGGSTGGLETSTLALGQARAALIALSGQVPNRDDLGEPFEALAEAWSATAADLLLAAEGHPDAPSSGDIRQRANSLVLRATQAYLTARKGSGFLQSDPAQRWARQALFFLVWSCPSPVAQAAIRDFAGLCPA